MQSGGAMNSLKRRIFLKAMAGSAGLAIGSHAFLKRLQAAPFSSAHPLFTVTSFSRHRIFIAPDAGEVVSFAAAELQKYLKKISGIMLEIESLPLLGGRNAVILSENPASFWELNDFISEAEKLREDGTAVKSARGGLALAGPNSRGALYAVYSFLEMLGCRFYGLGEEGEILPNLPVIDIVPMSVIEEPAFRRRDFTEDSGYAVHSDNPEHKDRLLQYWLLLADWFGKNRINTVNEWWFQNLNWVGNNVSDDRVWKEFRKRGITMWTGGHIIPMLLPRDLFEKKPDYFRMDQTGKRVSNGNFCPSNKEALALVAANAVQYVKDRPWADNVNVWGEDVWDGSWCFCPECGKMSVQDQYITTCNAVARAIRESGIDVEVAAIAYHDSIEPDVNIKPEPDLRLNWAPRERAYGFAHNDMRSEINQWYSRCLEKWTLIFGPENMDVFEYYTDNILFRTFPLSIPHVIARDAEFYRNLGYNNRFMMLSLGDYSWQAEPLNCVAFARLAYFDSLDVDTLIRDYCEKMYGRASATMLEWHNLFESGIRYTSQFGDIQRVPPESSPRVEKLMAEIRDAVTTLERASLLVRRALSETANPAEWERIRVQAWINEFAIRMTKGLLYQIRANFSFARIQDFVWSQKAQQRPNPHEGFQGRYAQARSEFAEAIRHYESATEFIRALPEKDKTVWLITSFYRHNKSQCDVMRAKIAECESHM